MPYWRLRIPQFYPHVYIRDYYTWSKQRYPQQQPRGFCYLQSSYKFWLRFFIFVMLLWFFLGFKCFCSKILTLDLQHAVNHWMEYDLANQRFCKKPKWMIFFGLQNFNFNGFFLDLAKGSCSCLCFLYFVHFVFCFSFYELEC